MACWSACAYSGSGLVHQYEATPQFCPASLERNRSMPPTQTVLGLTGSTVMMLSYHPWVNAKVDVPNPHCVNSASIGLVSSSVLSSVPLVLVTWVVQVVPPSADRYTARSPC